MRNTSGPLLQEQQHQNVCKETVIQFLLFSDVFDMLLYWCENKIFIGLYIPFSIILRFSSPAFATSEFFAITDNFAVSDGKQSRWTHFHLNMPGVMCIEPDFI